jgi:hypothetical protein
MSIKRYLPVRHTFHETTCRLFLLVLIGMLFLPPWISSVEGKVSKTKRTLKKQTASTAKAIKIEDISYHIEDGKESFMATLNRVYKPKVRYVKGANTHVIIVFTPVVDFEEKDYSKMIEGAKYVKQLRSYYEKDKKELRFVLDTNGTSDDYSITPVSGGSGNIFTIKIEENKSMKSAIPDSNPDPDEEAPSDLEHIAN